MKLQQDPKRDDSTMSVDPSRDPLHEAALMEECSFRVTDDKIERDARGEFEGIPSAWIINHNARRDRVFQPKTGTYRERFEQRNSLTAQIVESVKESVSQEGGLSDKEFRKALADIDALVQIRLGCISARGIAAWHAREFSCLPRLAKCTVSSYWIRVQLVCKLLLRQAGFGRASTEATGRRVVS